MRHVLTSSQSATAKLPSFTDELVEFGSDVEHSFVEEDYYYSEEEEEDVGDTHLDHMIIDRFFSYRE